MFYKKIMVGVFGFLLLLLLCFYFYRKNFLPIRVDKIEISVATSENVRLFILGDTGTGNKKQYAVAAAMERRCLEVGVPDGLVLLGDNFYNSGVKSVDDEQWEQKMFTPYSSPCLSQVPIYPVLGNHDYRGNVQAQLDMSRINSRWVFPHRFYRVSFGDIVKLIVFDSTFSDVCGLSSDCAVDFLMKEMKEKNSAWTLVSAHHPLKSISKMLHSHSGWWLGLFLTPIVCDHVDLWMSGHAHHLELRKFDDCKLHGLVSGGGGADLYEISSSKQGALYAERSHGFTDLVASKEKLLLSFVSDTSQILYSYQQVSIK